MDDFAADGARRETQIPVMRRFIIFSVLLFLVIIIAGSASFVLSMRQIIGNNKGAELIQILDIERIKLETLVNNEIIIALQLSDSPLIRRYFADPVGSSGIMDIVLQEIEAYRFSFFSDTVFWINDADKLFYSDDNEPFLLDTTKPENYWYPMTLYETEVYNFNINYNPDLNVTNLWVNAPVFDENHVPIGMLGTGVNITAFVDSVYTNYTGRADLYFYNEAGEITGAKNIDLVTSKRSIYEEFGAIGADSFAKAEGLGPDEILTLDTPLGKAALGKVPTLEWYIFALIPDTLEDYNTSMTWLFVLVVMIIAVIFVLFNIFIYGLLRPLRRTMHSLEIASQAKSDFLANMSHEMRTPMNAIIGMTTIGKRAPDLERKDYALDKIEDASTHLLGIISDVLDMSKIEADKLELSPIDFSFNIMLQNAMSVINYRVEEKRQKLSVSIDDNVPQYVVGDAQRLMQVIMNLLSNAVKFTPDGGEIKLSASLLDEKDEVCELLVKVTDTGIGISPEQQKRLFHAFEQAESGTSRKFGGTGLGLAISKRIVELMDGSIWVESELGGGASFIFTVKMKCCQYSVTPGESSLASEDLPDIPESEWRHDYPGKKLLVAEDVAINREVLLALLEGTGLVISCAENGLEAVDMILTEPDKYDLVFMDMQMPEMDGLEASREIRSRLTGRERKLPIIAMTANVFKSDIERCIASGMDGHIGKPLNIDEILKCLHKYLDSPAQRPAVNDERRSKTDRRSGERRKGDRRST